MEKTARVTGRNLWFEIEIENDEALIMSENYEPQLDIEVETRIISAATGAKNSISGDAWHGRTHVFSLPMWTDSEKLRSCLENEVFLNLAEKLCQETELFWDGSNHRGRLTSDGENYHESMIEMIRDWDVELSHVFTNEEEYVLESSDDFLWLLSLPWGQAEPKNKTLWKKLVAEILAGVPNECYLNFEPSEKRMVDVLKKHADNIWKEEI